jgi:heptosyltransferase-2
LSNSIPEFYNEAKTLAKTKSIIKNEIAICPGSQHFSKMYPIEYQIELCKMLVQNGFSVKLLGGKADKFICNLIKSEVPQVIDKSNDNNLFEIADEIATSEFVICNDSGLLHPAISNNIIAIFGSTVKEFGFAPNSDNVTIFEDNSLKCRPCSHVGKSKCPKKHFNCMLHIQPKQIINSICEFSRC